MSASIPATIEAAAETQSPRSTEGTSRAGSSPTNENLPPVLTPQELAALLRMRTRSVYEAIQRGDLPGVRRIGRKIRIDRDTVLKWLADGQGRGSRSARR